MKLLVVCTANVCRSPLAAAVLSRHLPDAVITSAGLRAVPGQPAALAVQTLALEGGYPDLSSHRSTPLLAGSLRGVDLVLAMENAHIAQLRRDYPMLTGRVRLYLEDPPRDVADPIGQDEAAFRACLATLETGAVAWRERLKRLGL